ncbi:MAG: magnesium/cobalt transporter CorA [Ignavibacteriae bacterium]|nr:magnesium and cobalt transport protein CorA [Ignavibacteriota bacterium]NOG99192.1 magnesium/cobalt transporter CorA [Ignavibacteriota bacterium]
MIKKIKKLTNIKKILSHKVGNAPGSLEYVGESKISKAQIVLRSYSERDFNEENIEDAKTIKNKIIEDRVNWIECTGLNDTQTIHEIGSAFDVHSMLLEDILNTQHLPKFEESESYNAIIIKAFVPDAEGNFRRNHICLVQSGNTVIHFQDFETEILKNKIERIKQSKGRARKLNSDYLFYILLDAFVDTYYLIFADINERISELEEQLLESAGDNLMEDIHSLKRELNSIRKNLFPLGEALNNIINDEHQFIAEDNLIFFRDIKDHVNQLVEFYVMYNENIKALVDLNNSNLNNNINAVMKTLTIIATIFIPLTFIAGLYGMNFNYMPELQWQYGYFGALGVMVIVGGLMVLYMKRKKWF